MLQHPIAALLVIHRSILGMWSASREVRQEEELLYVSRTVILLLRPSCVIRVTDGGWISTCEGAICVDVLARNDGNWSSRLSLSLPEKQVKAKHEYISCLAYCMWVMRCHAALREFTTQQRLGRLELRG